MNPGMHTGLCMLLYSSFEQRTIQSGAVIDVPRRRWAVARRQDRLKSRADVFVSGKGRREVERTRRVRHASSVDVFSNRGTGWSRPMLSSPSSFRKEGVSERRPHQRLVSPVSYDTTTNPSIINPE